MLDPFDRFDTGRDRRRRQPRRAWPDRFATDDADRPRPADVDHDHERPLGRGRKHRSSNDFTWN